LQEPLLTNFGFLQEPGLYNKKTYTEEQPEKRVLIKLTFLYKIIILYKDRYVKMLLLLVRK